MTTGRWLMFFVAVLTSFASSGAPLQAAKPAVPRRKVNLEALIAATKKLFALDTRKTPGSWMQAHPEKAQSFAAYRTERPTPLSWDYATMYVQPIGDFSDEQREIIDITQDYLSRMYGVPVKLLESLSEDSVPAAARRKHPSEQHPQILTRHVLDNLLKPRRPQDGVAVLGLTATDLWPGEGWNFVFGQASLHERVGVWSLNRFGDPAESEAERLRCLRRTLKVAGHETGHMFGLPHCTRSECGMNGSNHRDEMDDIRMPFCSECAAKIWWSTDRDPAAWYDTLLEFADTHQLDEEAAYWRMYRTALDEAKRR